MNDKNKELEEGVADWIKNAAKTVFNGAAGVVNNSAQGEYVSLKLSNELYKEWKQYAAQSKKTATLENIRMFLLKQKKIPREAVDRLVSDWRKGDVK